MITQELFGQLKLSRQDSKIMVEEFFEVIKQELEKGSNVKLSGFGNFVLRDKPRRPGRNPKTGKDIPILERRVVTFRPGLKLKTTVEHLES
jgi:integration host factor subunit alpha